ncbi:MAG: Trm112 family protein [Hadesarchaea archaeon]|nr:Trm112 family protein [Hadesarchaea archaeon]
MFTAKEVISSKLLEILACPVCKKRVELRGEELICTKCGRHYPIVDGIPNMII